MNFCKVHYFFCDLQFFSNLLPPRIFFPYCLPPTKKEISTIEARTFWLNKTYLKCESCWDTRFSIISICELRFLCCFWLRHWSQNMSTSSETFFRVCETNVWPIFLQNMCECLQSLANNWTPLNYELKNMSKSLEYLKTQLLLCDNCPKKIFVEKDAAKLLIKKAATPKLGDTNPSAIWKNVSRSLSEQFSSFKETKLHLLNKLESNKNQAKPWLFTPNYAGKFTKEKTLKKRKRNKTRLHQIFLLLSLNILTSKTSLGNF